MNPYLIDLPEIGLRVSSARLSMLAALSMVCWLLPRLAHRRAGLDPKRVRRAFVILALVALLGARLHYLLAQGVLWSDPWLALDLFSGGRHAAGALLALLVCTPLVCRALSLRFLPFADVGAIVFPAALAIQRVGCFLHGCCFGRECDLPWCVRFPPSAPVFNLQKSAGLVAPDVTASLPVHPLPLYFAAAGLITAWVAAWVERRKAYDGQALLIAVLLFSASSAALEPLRYNHAGRVHAFGLPQLLVVALFTAALAAAALVIAEILYRVARTSPALPNAAASLLLGARGVGGRLRSELRIGVPTATVVGAVFGFREGMLALAHNAAILPERYGYAYFAVPIVAWVVVASALACLIAALRAAVSTKAPADARAARAGYAAATVFVGALGTCSLWVADIGRVLAQITGRAAPAAGLALWLLALLAAGGCALLTFGVVRAAGPRVTAALQPRMRWIVLATVLVAAPIVWTFAGEVKLSFDEPRAIAGVPVSRGSSPGGSHPPNVVVISIDTLRADHSASVGVDLSTPTLDRIAAEGAVFTHAYSPAPWTLPSIASLLSGLRPSRHGAGAITNGRDPLARSALAGTIWTLPQAFRAAGYRTQAIVTNPYLSRAFGLDGGFGGYVNLTISSEFLLAGRETTWIRLLEWAVPEVWVRDRGSDVSRVASRWLAGNANAGPFFLWLHYVDPHPPYGAGTRHKSFRGDSLLASTANASAPVMTSSPDVARLRSGEIRLSDEEKAAVRRLYRDEVEALDRALARLFDALDEHGIAERTMVVIVSDHGEEFWEHGGVEHGHSLYDEILHVPFLVRFPNVVPAGLRISEPVSTLDAAPTIADLIGLDRPGDLDGMSLESTLRGMEAPPSRLLSAENLLFAEERTSLQRGATKYIRWTNGKEEVYDLASDPHELRDLNAIEPVTAPLRSAFALLQTQQQRADGRIEPRIVSNAVRAQLRALGYAQ